MLLAHNLIVGEGTVGRRRIHCGTSSQNRLQWTDDCWRSSGEDEYVRGDVDVMRILEHLSPEARK